MCSGLRDSCGPNTSPTRSERSTWCFPGCAPSPRCCGHRRKSGITATSPGGSSHISSDWPCWSSTTVHSRTEGPPLREPPVRPPFTSRLIAPLLFSLSMPRASSAAPGALHRLARTPPMGRNRWNHFGCDVSEQLVRETADAIVASGMRDAVDQYVVIDDCWQLARHRCSRIVGDSGRCPCSMQPLAAYVHSHGLDFGI